MTLILPCLAACGGDEEANEDPLESDLRAAAQIYCGEVEPFECSPYTDNDDCLSSLEQEYGELNAACKQLYLELLECRQGSNYSCTDQGRLTSSVPVCDTSQLDECWSQ